MSMVNVALVRTGSSKTKKTAPHYKMATEDTMSQQQNTAGNLDDLQFDNSGEKTVKLEFTTVETSTSVATTTTTNATSENQQPLLYSNQSPTSDFTDVDMVNMPSNEMNPAPVEVKEFMAKKFYCTRPGAFSHAVEDVKQYMEPELDGNFVGAWLLTEIDNWDHEKERLVILSEFQLLVIKYDFVALRINDCRKISLRSIEKVQSGGFVFPEKSLKPTRAFQTGIRIYLDKSREMTRWQRWNPLYTDIPYVTFHQHKVATLVNELTPELIYQDFKQAIIDRLTNLGVSFEATLESIEQEIYVGALSMMHNQSDLGFSKDRGAASF